MDQRNEQFIANPVWAERASRIMVALDYPDFHSAERLLEQLAGTGCYLKVGMQLFYSSGPSLVRELKSRNYRVFLDLKLHDIPNTVRQASASIARLGVDLFNVHAAGGVEMMRHAMLGVHDVLRDAQDSADVSDAAVGLPPSAPKVIAVTQLTSTSAQVMNEEVGIPGTVKNSVLHYARCAQAAGLAGVVASPHEVISIKETCGESFITVTPGIRPVNAPLDDQSRTMTPEEAFRAGTDYVVIGRPITKADDPRKAFFDIVGRLV